MIGNTAALERIEQAKYETPFCWCRAVTVPVSRPGGIWLRCTSLTQSTGGIRRLLTLDFGHMNRPIVDLSSYEAAA